jgi:flavin reductase (DIM6/NTAB) family NADH-FMN oxidoreductase RutF
MLADHPLGGSQDQSATSQKGLTMTNNFVSIEDFTGIMGSVCSQVAVVTTMAYGHPHGATVTAFCSLSLHPPMIVVALDHKSRVLGVINETGQLSINLLADDQRDLADCFATKSDNKFKFVRWRLRGELPAIDGNAGWLGCRVAHQVRGGDHDLLLCDVVDTAAPAMARRPLVYGSREFGTHSGLCNQLAASAMAAG